MKFFNKTINSSVATRTSLLVFVLISIIMLTGGFYLVNRVRKVVAEETSRQASRAMDGVLADIDSRISNVETAVATAASFADRSTQDESLCYELLYRLIGKNNDISAVTLLYRDSYFPELGRYYAPTVTRDPLTGELEADEIGGPENDFCYIETDSNWIYTNKLEEGYWCLPYVDSMSTKRAMVTYSVPLYDAKDSIYAVLCADVALDWVSQVMEEAKPYDFSRVIVLSRDSQYVCHPEPEWIQSVNVIEQAHAMKDSDFLNLASRMLSWQRGTDTLLEDITYMSANDKARNESTIVYYAPVPRVQWAVSFTMPEDKIMEQPNMLRRSMIVLLLIMLVLISVALNLVVRAQIWPLKQLALATRDIARGEFDKQLPVIHTHDEISHLRDSFEEMQSSLSHYIEELQASTAAKASIQSELKVASEIQMSMLPKLFPPYPDRNDIDIFGALTPAKAVGGDLYDFYIRDEKLFFCIGDVSGKGVPASLVMAVTRSLFRTISQHESQPDRILAQINNTLSDQNESNMFVTLFAGVLDLPSGRLRYSNAGHDSPLLVGDGVESLPCDSNIPAGVMEDWKYTLQEAMVQSQTTIFLYTDGLTEAENIRHELFAEERVKAVAEEACQAQGQKPTHLIDRMTKAVHAFVGDAEQSDDLTMLAIQYTKQQLAIRYQNELVLTNEVTEVPRLAEFVEEACDAAGFDMAATMQLNLALEEAVVNVIDYAYPAGTKGDIFIEAQANEQRLKFTITDSGIPFDPTAKEEVDTSLSAEERPIGGLGIHLVRQIMDSINYERLNGHNVLTLRKKIQK
ncbi:MAG: SpoIIE family protein phosphatase [Bacteroidaceae bacterium]|nr:SpoIIE family protein phosphatase [Bacteroidaceae bacterium]